MRKAQKQQAEELVKQMEEAHDQIKQYMEQGSVQSAMELLEDCQNGGIAIGTLIEETQGGNHPTVTLLEDYCELLYRIHTDLADHKETNSKKVYKLLRQKLIKIGNSIRNDIPIRTEAVFLPYKASMWDSLESVWKAADEDPNCDAYVIPIPYYDKNPDGSFREMHYEGDLYPDYVSITKYDEFDFEVHRPDEIYIHNPYDNLNYVTSVPPFFFSENLKKYTDKLVYIPYFVLNEIKPDDDDAIEGMKHFVTTPAVFNAHKVIVQSEDMKQVYIKVLLDATNDYSEAAKKYWDDKILGLGSPKIDKVLNTKKVDLEIPPEWLRIIEKPDGSWKKIIFYNTSVGALLQYNEKMLTKMEHIFCLFKENQDDVALLWRPHPLIKATVESMRPQLWLAYDRIVRKYREEGWGIYDDSSDINRAIILSDAYYGAGSSVVQMYQQTGKPVMLQNVDVIEETPAESEICLNFRGCVRTKNKIYFSNMEFNGLFEMSLDSFEITHVHTFSGIGLNMFFCAGQYIMMHQNKLIFLLNEEKQSRLCCFDLVTKEEQKIDFPITIKPSMICCYTFVYGESGWIIPFDMSLGIYVMDMNTLHLEKDKVASELLRGYKWGLRCVRQDEKTFYFVDSDKNEVIIADVVSGYKKSHKIPIANANNCAIQGKKIWLTQAETTDVFEWDMEKETVNKYVLEKKDLWNKEDIPYSNLIYIKEQDCVFLVGMSIGAILKSNREKNTIEVAFDFPKGFRFVKNKVMHYSYFAEVERLEDELWFYPVCGNMILIYDIRKNTVKGVKSTIQVTDIPYYKEILYQEMKNTSFREYEGIYSIENTIKAIQEI